MTEEEEAEPNPFEKAAPEKKQKKKKGGFLGRFFSK